MASLNPQTLCNIYTLAEIETKITFFMDQMERATVKEYRKDSTQGMQNVESAEIAHIEKILQSWLKAKECKTGVGQTHIISGNFRNSRFS